MDNRIDVTHLVRAIYQDKYITLEKIREIEKDHELERRSKIVTKMLVTYLGYPIKEAHFIARGREV